MKFYVTIEGVTKLKRSFLNLKLFSIIHVPEILEKFGYTFSTVDEYGSFIVSNKIEELIRSFSKSKRIRGIIYSNPAITEDLLPKIFDSISDNEAISEVVLMDDYYNPKLKHLYSHFEEIVFFPSVKKVRLIECTQLPISKEEPKEEQE